MPSPPGLEDVLGGKEQTHHSLKKGTKNKNKKKKGTRQEFSQQFLSSLNKLYLWLKGN